MKGGTAQTATAVADKQWIELYNNTGATKDGMNHTYIGVDGRTEGAATYDVAPTGRVTLLFTVNTYFGANAHADVPSGRKWIATDATTWTGHNTRPTIPAGANDHSNPAGTDNVLYYKVVDRVSNMGRGGRQGPLPGQSGRVVAAVGPNNNPSIPLISAYRKRVLNLDDNTGIGTYHDGHRFENGTKIGSWMASWVSPNAVRRVNIDDEYIASPGARTPHPEATGSDGCACQRCFQ